MFKVSVRVILQCIYLKGGHSPKVPENMIQEFEFKKQQNSLETKTR